VLLSGAARVSAQALPIVALRLEGDWPSELGAEVRADLRASLRERGLALVDTDERPEGVLATILIEAPSLDRPVARIEIDDRVSEKQVEREISLGRDPPDTWSVVLAASADELLRASWVELTMIDAPPPAITPPPEVERAARESIAPEGQPDGPVGVTIAAAVEGYLGGAVLAGGDLGVTLYPSDVLGIDLALVGRGLVPATSSFGGLDATAFGGDLGARVSLLPRVGMLRLELLFGLRAMLVEWRPSAASDAIATAAEAFVLIARGGVRVGLALPGQLHVALAFTAGAPMMAAVAADARGNIAGIEGLELGGRLELSWWP
jgi:hypothetical protein